MTMSDIGRMKLPGAGDDGDTIRQLHRSENQLLELIRSEARVKHHIRTKAILMNVESNSRARLNVLEEALERAGQSV